MKQHLFTLSLAALLFAACGNKVGQPIRLQGETQGSYYSIIYYDSLQRNFQPQIDSLLHDFDLTANLWVDSSIIRRINRNEDTLISEMFRDILLKSLEINRYTHGAFNCKIGTLVNLYGFGFENRQDVSNHEIDSILAFVGIEHTRLNGDKVVKDDPRVQFDFSSIAKGMACDEIAAMLARNGAVNYMVEIGGEVVAQGVNQRGETWRVSVDMPMPDDENGAVHANAMVVNLDSLAIATSGSYRKFKEVEGKKVSHIINPKTGRSEESPLLSVSIVAPDCMTADAWATACMAMGLEKTQGMMEKNNSLGVMTISADEQGNFVVWSNKRFAQQVKSN